MSAKNRQDPPSGKPSRRRGLPPTPVTLAVRDRTARALGILYAVLAVAWVPLVVWSILRESGALVLIWAVLAVATALLAWFSFSVGGGTITLGPDGAHRSGLAGWHLDAADVEDVRFARSGGGLPLVRVSYGEAASRLRGVSLAAGLSRRYDAFRSSSRIVSLPLRPDAADAAERALPAA
ncbi:hypothetical protein [Propionicicella superfundia]|uniref:hypothetical protein n=1 Tax=Propionicicella superfundia TaxID=348582 RepID=UPI00048CA5B9|nr:hypothetical protein [Propionicicella superfundia]